MRSRVLNNNAVRFLMDGYEYFYEIKRLFDDLAAQSTVDPQRNYARLAFWAIHPYTSMPPDDPQAKPNSNGKGGPDLEDAVKAVVNSGHEVDIICWMPNLKARRTPGDPADMNKKHAKDLAEKMAALNELASSSSSGPVGRVRVYRERYEGLTGMSQHQKVVVFCINGHKTALVGGFNFEDYYVDNSGHSWLKGGWKSNADGTREEVDGPWHDTALMVEGPAVDEVEREFVRRWGRAEAIQAKRATPRSLRRQVTSNFGSRFRGRKADRQGAVRAGGFGPSQAAIRPAAMDARAHLADVQVATTRAEGSRRERDIRDIMVDKIARADHYVYLENVTVTSPCIARALRDRLTARPDLKVVMVVTADMKQVSNLTRRTWLQVALRLKPGRLRSVTIDTGSGIRTIRRNDCQQWAVRDSATPTVKVWPDSDTLTFKLNSSTALETVAFCDIVSVDSDINVYSPFVVGATRGSTESIMVHSKLAIIDGEHLICGSANWTYRSMNYDGEITLFAKSGPLATSALKRLLDHYHTVGSYRVSLKNIYTITSLCVDPFLDGTLHNSDTNKLVALLPLDHPSARAAIAAARPQSARPNVVRMGAHAQNLVLERFAPTQQGRAVRAEGKNRLRGLVRGAKQLAAVPGYRFY